MEDTVQVPDSLIVIFKQIYRDAAVALDQPTGKLTKAELARWGAAQPTLYWHDLQIGLKKPVQAVLMVRDLFADTYHIMEWLCLIWPFLVLSGKPVPKHNMARATVAVKIEFTDGTVIPVSKFMFLQLDAANPVVTDSYFIGKLNILSQNLFVMLGELGLDALHDHPNATKPPVPTEEGK